MNEVSALPYDKGGDTHGKDQCAERTSEQYDRSRRGRGEDQAHRLKSWWKTAFDAHAHDIAIDIIQGGIENIVITDDGEGMDAQDATTAFERHATSKMKEENDLWNIHTMGFRGEALPSIASVSHVNLQTNDGHQGTEVEISYGKI